MAIKAFSGGIQNQPLPEINLENINDGDILVYSTAQKAFQNTAGSFTTIDQVNALIANINSGGTVDLSNYATTTALSTSVTNLTALIDGKTTESYVDAKIAALPGPTDLSDYVTNADLSAAIANFDTGATIDGKINTAIANATFFDGDYNNLFNTPTIPSLNGYATQLWVQQQINAIPGGGGGGATALGGLTDVDTTNASAGQVLKYDGNSWSPADDITTGGGGTDADTLDGFDSQYYLDYNNLNNTPTIPTSYTDADAIAAITSSSLDMGSNDIITTGKLLYKNVYATIADLPSASTYHGMFAHVHATGKAYFAHAGNWVALANESDVPVDVSDLTDTTNLLSGAGGSSYTDASVDTHLNKASAASGQVLGWDGSDYIWVNNSGGGGGATSLGGLSDVSSIAPQTGQILKWNGTEWAPAVDATTGVGGSNYATEAYVDQKLTERGPHFSGDYNALTNTPILFSGDYNDLLNKPAGNADLSLQLVGTDLQLLNIEPDPDTIISSVSLSSLGAAIGNSIDYADLQNLPNLFSGDYNDLVNRPNLFSGDYNDLSNKPVVPSIAGLASTTYVDSAIQGATTGDKVFEANVSQVAKVSNVVAASQDNFIISITTTDDAVTEALLMSGNRIEIEDNSTVMYDIHVVGADSTEHHGVKIKGIIDRTSGTTSLVGSPAKEILVENDDGWNANVVADTLNGSLKITVQGEANRTVQWTIFVELKTVKR